MVCPANLIYNEVTNRCEWPYTPTTSTTSSPITGSQCGIFDTTFCLDKADGQYANPANPRTFFSCVEGTTYCMVCPANLIYNEVTNRCEWPYAPTTSTTSSPITGSQCGIFDTTFCQNKADGQYANPANPRTFFSCVEGTTYCMVCPANLIYNEVTNRCEWPYTPTTSTTSSPITGSQCGIFDTTFCLDKADGQYANPANPRTFFSCVEGTTYCMVCPANLIYNEVTNRCEWPYTPTTSTTSSPITGSQCGIFDTTFCQDKADGQYANPANPRTFFSCVEGTTYCMVCPANLIYNEVTNRCEWPYTPTTSTTSSPITGSQCGIFDTTFCQNKSDGQYANPANPTTFFSCVGGTTYCMVCPANLIYNEVTNRCEWPHTPTTSTTSSPITGSQCRIFDTTFCLDKADGQYANPANPTTFFSCVDGTTYCMVCPANLIYNEVTNRCEWPYTPTTSTTSSPITGSQCGIFDTTFCQNKSDGQYANPANPTTFFSCVEGTTYCMVCPANLIYNEVTNRCEWPYTPTTSTTSSPITGSQCGIFDTTFCLDKADGQYANPANPRTFFSCVEGTTYCMVCPANLIYNEVTNRCEWPYTPTTSTTSSPITGSQCGIFDTTFCQDKADGQYANPANPTTFFSCVEGTTYCMVCPANLIYNEVTNRCEWPYTPTTSTTSSPITGSQCGIFDTPFCQDKSNGQYANPANPRTFFSCFNGTTDCMVCPANLIYNEVTNRCEWPYTPTTSTTSSPITGSQCGIFDTTFCQNKSDGQYANPANPTTFFSCFNGTTDCMVCPANLIYNEVTNHCEWPYTPTTSTTSSPITGSQCGIFDTTFCQDKADGQYANPANQRTFFSCFNGTTYCMVCPANLIYNEVTNRCEWPYTPTTSTTSSPITGSQCGIFDTTFCQNKSDGQYANPANPTTFFSCFNGTTYCMVCPANLIYNEVTNRCEWPYTPTTSTTSSPITGSQCGIFDTTFCQDKADGQYANPANPTTFFSCFNGTTDCMVCPANLIYNEVTNRCEWPYTPTTSTTSSPITGSQCGIFDTTFCQNKSDGQYANPANPTTFFSCFNGTTYCMVCPANLIYNEVTNRCEWPYTPTTSTTSSPITGSQCGIFDTTFCQNKSDGQYANPANPTTFFSCFNGTTDCMVCPANLIYNEVTNRCEWPYTPTTSTTSSPITGSQCGIFDTTFCQDKADGQYANPANPTTFFSCFNGTTDCMVCPANLIYNEVTNRCEWPYTPTTSTTSSPITGSQCGIFDTTFCQDKADGQYANPANPTTFFSCFNGTTDCMVCPANLIYNEVTNRCEWPYTPTTSSTSSPITSSLCGTYDTTFCHDKEDGQYANPPNPRTFLSCCKGVTYCMVCPSNLIYNEDYNRCE
uniref:mucin-5AC-like n=1 Tax=Myxine glutinosa TaxID=7769 RepID=UPI00358E1EBB